MGERERQSAEISRRLCQTRPGLISQCESRRRSKGDAFYSAGALTSQQQDSGIHSGTHIWDLKGPALQNRGCGGFLYNMIHFKVQIQGRPWWSSGEDSAFPMQGGGSQVRSLVRELDPTYHN